MSKPFRIASVLAALAAASSPGFAAAEVQVSGLADVVFKNTGESELTNQTFKGYTTFDTVRLRLFFDAQLAENISVFSQLLTSLSTVDLYGAYVRFSEVGGTAVNVHLGLIPNTVGSFGERTYSDKNPLIGTPLMWVHHSTLNPSSELRSVEDLVAGKQARTRFGLPILYDNCWSSGVEAFGSADAFDWSFGLLTGSVTNMTRNQEKDTPQATGRLAWNFGPELRLGVSAYYGPYLLDEEGGAVAPLGHELDDYMNSAIMADVYWGSRWIDVNAEAVASRWEYPGLPDLGASSGYVEAKWKVRPRWFVAGRIEAFRPNEVEDSAGSRVRWDDALHRFEYGVGYKPRPRTTIKLVGQNVRFDEVSAYDADLVATQVSVAF